MASAPKIPPFPRRLLAKIREPGYTRTGQQDTDAILQDEVTRTRHCPRHERAFSVRDSMQKYSGQAAACWPTAGLLEFRNREATM
jgi:hypothetical protein